jgi:putative Ca2+/H+ antiporter (TMEM165/GDT1 family)
LTIAVAVFPVIFLAELPDKSMFAALLLATRGRPISVWAGAALAFAVHTALSVTIGGVLFALLPPRVVEAIVALLFLGGGVLLCATASPPSHPRASVLRTSQGRGAP